MVLLHKRQEEMATNQVARSPRSPRSPKVLRKVGTYHIDVHELSERLEVLKKVHKALMELQAYLSKGGKGVFLTFPVNPDEPDGDRVPLTKAHLKFANSKYNALVKDLKKFITSSRKNKTTNRGDPSKFSGIYSPIFATDALRTFFTSKPENFSIHRKDDLALLQSYLNALSTQPEYSDPEFKTKVERAVTVAQNLIPNLYKVQQGFLLRNTCTMLFFIYAKANHLHEDNAQFVHSDAVMDASFGGNIPAMHFILPDAQKIYMEQAVASGVISAPLSTYDVIRRHYPAPVNTEQYIEVMKSGDKTQKALYKKNFTPKYFASYMFQNLASPNYISADMASQLGPENEAVVQGLNDPESRQQMLQEHQLVREVKDLWNQMMAPAQKAKRDANKKAKDALKPKKARQNKSKK
jgi:hypothetical protein